MNEPSAEAKQAAAKEIHNVASEGIEGCEPVGYYVQQAIDAGIAKLREENGNHRRELEKLDDELAKSHDMYDAKERRLIGRLDDAETELAKLRAENERLQQDFWMIKRIADRAISGNDEPPQESLGLSPPSEAGQQQTKGTTKQ